MANEVRVTPTERLRSLRQAIETRGMVRIAEAHSGLSGIIAETAHAMIDNEWKEYDGIWESSLTDSATKGLPDASIIGFESRLHTINEILHVTTKPLIVDGDTGGEIPQFEYLVTQLERIGVSAVVIEDKVFPKRNSLDQSAMQNLEDPDTFARKIQAGKSVTVDNDFMIMARLESLIAGTGLRDALERAEQYILAGADGIMIHSNRQEPEDLFSFVDSYQGLCQRLGRRPPLVSVPTTYNSHSDTQLAELGFNIIIHANHLLRASHKAMKEAAHLILETDSSSQLDDLISPVKEIFTAVGFHRIASEDREREKTLHTPVIIPAAGIDRVFPEHPKSLIPVAGKRLLDYQLESTRKVGIKQLVIVRGHEGRQYDSHYADDENIVFCDNPSYATTQELHSLMRAETYMGSGFVMIFSDILFDYEILNRLIRSGKDIVLGIDSSYTYHKHEADKRLDLVVSRKRLDGNFRSLHQEPVSDLAKVGNKLDLNRADYEFIGMAYFSEKGSKILRETYHEIAKRSEGPFQEAISFPMAIMTDMFQELIDRGFPVHGLKVYKGWREIHTRSDAEAAGQEMMELVHQP